MPPDIPSMSVLTHTPSSVPPPPILSTLSLPLLKIGWVLIVKYTSCETYLIVCVSALKLWSWMCVWSNLFSCCHRWALPFSVAFQTVWCGDLFDPFQTTPHSWTKCSDGSAIPEHGKGCSKNTWAWYSSGIESKYKLEYKYGLRSDLRAPTFSGQHAPRPS